LNEQNIIPRFSPFKAIVIMVVVSQRRQKIVIELFAKPVFCGDHGFFENNSK
jgi:hypothetical protein